MASNGYNAFIQTCNGAYCNVGLCRIEGCAKRYRKKINNGIDVII
jgi:hypothetical protein